MVDPLTLSAISLIVVSASSFFHLLGPACDWWRIRFKPYELINYELGSAEYAALWAILSHPAHVQSKHVSRRERRQLNAESVPCWTTTQMMRFEWGGKTVRLAHGHDEMGRTCIHMFCFWKSELRFFEHKLTNGKMLPERLTLVGCSGK